MRNLEPHSHQPRFAEAKAAGSKILPNERRALVGERKRLERWRVVWYNVGGDYDTAHAI